MELLEHLTSTNSSLGNIASLCSALLAGIAILFNAIQIHTDKKYRLRQANNISAWITTQLNEDRTNCIIYNSSTIPIYSVVINPVLVYSQDNTTEKGPNIYFEGAIFNVVPPGKYEFSIVMPDYGMNRNYALEIAFIDINQRSWRIQGNGKIEKLHCKNIISKYNIPVPFRYDSLTPLC